MLFFCHRSKIRTPINLNTTQVFLPYVPNILLLKHFLDVFLGRSEEALTLLGCFVPLMKDERSNHSSVMENWTRNNVRSKHGPVPEWCGCGCRPVLMWSGTETHPNKSFFRCSNYNVDSVQDEVPMKSDEENKKGEMKMNIAWRVGKLKADVKNIKVMIQVLGLGIFIVFVFVLMLVLKV
ncbi:hypothetical protein Ahy_Scaffold1g106968 isoform B [Arachis hypogaea]|uniref:Uncharacterized protein n=2 Tax=Arachis hypogaea TaxID=3818 RepID=A0A444WTV3_ARAHY|nr:hypothetical protein Ahy_Scaffold1g106968 isoform B [Arachis hypogaea]